MEYLSFSSDPEIECAYFYSSWMNSEVPQGGLLIIRVKVSGLSNEKCQKSFRKIHRLSFGSIKNEKKKTERSPMEQAVSNKSLFLDRCFDIASTRLSYRNS